MTPETVDPTVLGALIQICELKTFELDSSICIGDSDNAVANRSSFAADVTGFEAFVNHVHLGDLWLGRTIVPPSMERLQAIARIVVACWAVSLLPLLNGRSIVFFAGGTSVEDFTVRFHIDRGTDNSWVDVGASAFLNASALAVWRFSNAGLELLHEW